MKMNDQLLDLRDQLGIREGLRVDLRGSGEAAFLCIRSSERAAEVSIEERGFFLEFWDEADEESDGAAVRSESVHSVSEVVKRLKNGFSSEFFFGYRVWIPGRAELCRSIGYP
jgi:hypothetical protein